MYEVVYTPFAEGGYAVYTLIGPDGLRLVATTDIDPTSGRPWSRSDLQRAADGLNTLRGRAL